MRRAKFTPEGLHKSSNTTIRPSAWIPTYALAYAGLSASYLSLGNLKVIPLEEALSKARFAAERALALDDSLAEHVWQWGASSTSLNGTGSRPP